MSIEIHVPTGGRTLGGTARAVIEALQNKGFQNIDPPESGALEVELMNADGVEWAKAVPEEASAVEIGDQIKADREIVRVRIGLRLGCFLLFPGFCVLCRPDEYESFEGDPKAKQIIGREALELARAFGAKELIVAGDAASDFLGTEANNWDQLKDVLEEEEIEHRLIVIPPPKPGAGSA